MPNWDKLGDNFTITKKYIYLGNAAIAPIPVSVYNKVSEFYSEVLSHAETSWNQWEAKTEETRDWCAKLIGADSRDGIALTHSTSEGMNIVAHMLSDKGIVLSNELEFPSSNLPWLNKNANSIKFVSARDGNKILIEDTLKMIDEEKESNTGVVIIPITTITKNKNNSHKPCTIFYRSRQDLEGLNVILSTYCSHMPFYILPMKKYNRQKLFTNPLKIVTISTH
jgi:selenocysteine lyase/cysteine desulfurase